MKKKLTILGIIWGFLSVQISASEINNYDMLDNKPILIIGSSYINSKTRIDDDGIGSLGGLTFGVE